MNECRYQFRWQFATIRHGHKACGAHKLTHNQIYSILNNREIERPPRKAYNFGDVYVLR